MRNRPQLLQFSREIRSDLTAGDQGPYIHLLLSSGHHVLTGLGHKATLCFVDAKSPNLLLSSLQAHPNPSGNWSEWVLSLLHLPNAMHEEVPNRPLDYYTCPFKASKLDK